MFGKPFRILFVTFSFLALIHLGESNRVQAGSFFSQRVQKSIPRLGDPPVFIPGERQPFLPEKAQSPEVTAGWAYLAYQSYRDGNWEIYFSPDLGYTQTRLTTNTVIDQSPRLNRQITRIVYSSRYSANNDDIFTINLDGTNKVRLTTSGENDETVPNWSPNGDRIVYASNASGDLEIYVMNADGSAQTALTSNTVDDYYPAWSPDGSKIAFMRYSNGLGALWLMNADGSGAQPLTPSYPYMQAVAWSPDGTRLAFDADVDGDGWNELAIVNIDGSDLAEFYDANQDGVDAWMGCWASNGEELLFSRAVYTYYSDEWYVYETNLAKMRFGQPYLDFLTGDGMAMWPDYQSIDKYPPDLEMDDLPEYSRYRNTFIRWHHRDVGGSGVEFLQIQSRLGLDGDWSNFLNGYGPVTFWPFDGTPGQKYYFRGRARDAAGYWSDWSSNISHTTFYTLELRGRVYDNRGYSLPGVPVSIDPLPVTGADTGPEARYFARLSATGNHTVLADYPGYQTLATSPVDVDQDAEYDLRLRPSDDVLQNGGFEADPNQALGWTSTPAVTLTASNRNTGQWAARSGVYCQIETCLGEPQFIPNDYINARSLAADPQGNLHLILGIVYTGVAHKVRSPDSTWSDPVIIPGSAAGGNNIKDSDLVSDAQGNLYAVWGWSHSSDAAMYFSERPAVTGEWSQTLYLGKGSTPSLGVDSLGGVHVIYTNNLYEIGIYYLERTPAGEWLAPVKLSHSSIAWDSEDIAVGPDDAVHLLWFEDPPGQEGTYHQVRYSDGSWSQVETLPLLHHQTRVIVDGMNTVHAFSEGEYMFRPAGGSWSSKERITLPNVPLELALNSHNVLYILSYSSIEHNGFHYFKRKPAGGTWSEPVGIAKEDWAAASFALDSADKLHVILASIYQEENWGFLHFTDRPPAEESTARLEQSQMIAANMNRPTLSFWYSLASPDEWQQSGLVVTATAGMVPTTVFSAQAATGWTHAWVDLTPWMSQTITVTFALHQAGGEPYVHLLLDDVSLGSWLTPLVTNVLPARIESQWASQTITITGENFLFAPSVWLGSTQLLDVIWMDEHTLQAILPDGLAAGNYHLWVVNPSGQKGVKSSGFWLGRLKYLPVVIR